MPKLNFSEIKFKNHKNKELSQPRSSYKFYRLSIYKDLIFTIYLNQGIATSILYTSYKSFYRLSI